LAQAFSPSALLSQAGLRRKGREKGLFLLRMPRCAGGAAERALSTASGLKLVSLSTPQSHEAAARALGITKLDDTTREAVLRRAGTMRAELLRYHLAGPTAFVAGYAAVTPALLNAHAPHWETVLLLRSPGARMRAALAAARLPGAGWAASGETFARLIETRVAAAMGSVYAGALSGLPPGAPVGREDIDRAKRTLEAATAVLFADQPQELEDGLSALIGRKLRLARPATAMGPRVPALLNERIEELCAPDREVYAHARALFAERRVSRR
jgi:hypothetical protein